MKHNNNHDNAPSPGPHLVLVSFKFSHPTASTVAVVGSFNEWHIGSNVMHSAGNGQWLKETALLPGTYEYCLLVDGRWMPDPLALESVPNPFGGRNSMLRVAESPAATHLINAEVLPLKNANKKRARRL